MAVKIQRFKDLHLAGQALVRTWFEKGWAQRDCPDEGAFEPFIYTYIAFNGWASCVTEQERDTDMLKDLKRDNSLRTHFTRWLAADAPFKASVEAFSELWPIFSARELRELGLDRSTFPTRADRIEAYLEGGAQECWPHQGDRRLILGNVLSAVYQVRCNLFHGGKSITSENDRRIVGAAFRVLTHLLGHMLALRHGESPKGGSYA